VRAVPEPAGDGRVVGRVPDRVEPTATPGGSEQRLSSELVDGVGPRLSEVPIECVNGPVADPDDAFALLAVLKRGTRVGSVMEVNVLLVVKSPSSIELETGPVYHQITSATPMSRTAPRTRMAISFGR
jgi:hypothetical protein